MWEGAWKGMARTDPDAKWLYQGWAIRGWNNAEGASRLKALFDVVPKGQVRNAVFAPFIYKNDHFAKTGSGQT
eukprot:COSAG06_NODE_2367_length_7000_cov_16.568179_8_plen_73_part_00